MVDINNLSTKLHKDLSKLNNNESIVIKSFKKDRSVIISRIDNQFLVYENGYSQNNFEYQDFKICYKAIQKIIKIEFPRSNNLWYSIRNNYDK